MTNLFGSESIAAIAPLLTQMGALKTNFDNVATAAKYAGSMQGEYNSRSATTANEVQLAENNFSALKITLGTQLLPTITAVMKRGAAFAAGIADWSKANPALSKGILLITGTLGAVMMLMGGFGIVAAGLIAPLAALSTVATFFGVSMWAVAWPIMAIIAGIAALVAATYLIYSNWGAIGGWFAGLWASVKAIFGNAIAAIGSLFSSFNPLLLLMGPIGAMIAFMSSSLPSRFAEIGGNMIRGLIRGVLGMLGALKSTIVGAASAAATWFKAKLGIHSPSRVFHGFGGHMMAGLANGIAGGEDGPVRRIDSLSKRLTAAVAIGTALPAIAAPGAISAGSSYATSTAPAGGGDRYEIHLHAAPGMDEAKLVALLQTKLDEIERAKAAKARSSFADRPDWDPHA